MRPERVRLGINYDEIWPAEFAQDKLYSSADERISVMNGLAENPRPL
jgi:hypothetical protein